MSRARERALEARRLQRSLYDLSDFWLDLTDSRMDDTFRDGSLKMFVTKIGFDRVVKFMSVSAEKLGHDPEQAIRYLCGICWNVIRQEGL